MTDYSNLSKEELEYELYVETCTLAFCGVSGLEHLVISTLCPDSEIHNRHVECHNDIVHRILDIEKRLKDLKEEEE